MPEPSNPLSGVNPTLARISGVAAILAPILLLASTIAYITDGGGINDGRIGGTVGVWAALAFALAFAGISWAIEPVAPRAAPILLTLSFLGWAAGVGFNIDAILSAEFGRTAVDTATEDHPFTLLAYVPWGWLAPVSVTATGVVLWRARAFSRLSAALLVAAGALFIASRPARVESLAVLADCVAIVALVPIGWTLLTGRRIGVTTQPTAVRLDAERSAAAPEAVA